MKHIIIAALLAASQATAASLTHFWTKPISQAGWSTNVAIPQFNPALGYLVSATVTLARTNLITIEPSSTGVGVGASVTVTNGFSLDAPSIAYDDDQSVTASASTSAPEGYVIAFNVDESLYSGTSFVTNVIATVGTSFGSGSGNWNGVQGNYLGASLWITYCYVPNCPPRPPCYYRKPVCRFHYSHCGRR